MRDSSPEYKRGPKVLCEAGLIYYGHSVINIVPLRSHGSINVDSFD